MHIESKNIHFCTDIINCITIDIFRQFFFHLIWLKTPALNIIDYGIIFAYQTQASFICYSFPKVTIEAVFLYLEGEGD